jgi:two-component system CheB/CheR fusion protein
MAKKKQAKATRAKSEKEDLAGSAGPKKKQAPRKNKPAATKRPPRAITAEARGKDAAKAKVASASTPQSEVPADKSDCVVVGIGASAGGLDSFKRFLQAMPHDSGLAFVLIQHLDPSHESLMADLLSKHTAMPVVETEDATTIPPNCVYMIPPNKYIKIQDGGLFLDEPVKHRGMRMPIDYFFRSLANARQERAVAIVLSGTGTDGTMGVKEVKVQGGMVMVQKPESAEYDGMPRSALSTGVADFLLPIEEMPEILVKYGHHPYVRAGDAEPTLSDTAPDHFKSIINLLRAHIRRDRRARTGGLHDLAALRNVRPGIERGRR